ncbi:MAG: InlB B-repeat-containing protein [Treponema sp.]|jgi:hypothetical protein|nr:InlB B-repeat-containing protein [Treponema sp.]
MNRSYTVTFDRNSGSDVGKRTVEDPQTTVGALPTPTKSDVHFQGWYTRNGTSDGDWGSDLL